MRRTVSFVLAVLLLASFLSHSFAASAISDTVTYFGDGSYITTYITVIDTRATNSKVGSRTFTYTKSNGEVAWKAVLTGNFTYNGFTAYCGTASCDFTIYDSAYSVASESTTKVGATAKAEWTIIEKFLGVTISQEDYSMTLTCDKNGNLS